MTLTKCPRCDLALRPCTKGGVSFRVCDMCQTAYCDVSALSSMDLSMDDLAFSDARCHQCGQTMQEIAFKTEGLKEGKGTKCPKCGMLSAPIGHFLRRLRTARVYSPREAIKKDREYIHLEERDRAFAFIFQVPIEMSKHVSRAPFVTMSLMATCVVVFILEIVGGPEFAASLALDRSEFTGFSFLTMLTSMFAHADIVHLVGNLYFLYAFGRLVEDRVGEIGFLLFFLGTGYLGSVSYLLLHLGQEGIVLGASGAISGVLGLYLVLFPTRKIGWSLYFKVVPVPAVIYFVIWFLFQFLAFRSDAGNVAYDAHIIGFLMGVAFGVGLRRNVLGVNDLLVDLPDLKDILLEGK